MSEGAPLGLLFVHREGLVGDVMLGGHLGPSDHEMRVFLILGELRLVVTRITAALDVTAGLTLACLGAWLPESLGRQS